MSQADPGCMTFLEHLGELRNRLLHIIAGVLVMTVVGLIWSEELFSFFLWPLRQSLPAAELIGTGPADAFLVKLRTAFISGFLFSCPYSFFHLWRFIAPGLIDSERHLAMPFIVASTVFFLLGVSFCFFGMLPFAFQFFFAQFESITVKPAIRINEYLAFTVQLLLVFGVVFELPVLCYFLAQLGLVTSRWLIAQGRIAVVVIFVVAAVLTPPDVISQTFLALPLLLLYGMCIGIARFVEKKRVE